MTIAKTGSSASYAGNGVTVAFSFPFRFFDDTDLKVYIVAADGTSTLQTLTTDYSISNAGDETGGTVTMVTAPASTETLLIEREVPETQSVDYQNNDAFPAETHEQALDRLTLLVQQQSRGDGLHLTFPTGDTNSPVLPTSSLRVNKLLGFGTGGAIETYDTTTGVIDTEFDTVAALLASTKSFDVGVYVRVKDGDFTYKVVAASGNLGQATSGGVELDVISSELGYNVKAFGATGDGVTDDTSEVTAALAAGDVIYFPDGDYDLATWTVQALSGKTLHGTGNIVGTTSLDFIQPTGAITLKGLTFNDWNRVLENDNADSGTVTFMQVEGCTFLNCNGVIDMERPLDTARITNNRFEGMLTTYAIRIGRNVYAEQDTWLDMVISSNTFKDMNSSGSSNTSAMLIYGQKATIENNVIEDVLASGTGEAWGIYTKCRYTAISGNTIKNVTSTSGPIYAINIKGAGRGLTGAPQGYVVSVVGNTLFNGATGNAIHIQNDDVAVVGNVIEGFDNGIIGNTTGFDNAKIADNIIYNVGTFGINANMSGNNVSITGNVVDTAGTTCINVTSAIADVEGYNISGNTLANSGTGIDIGTSSKIIGVRIGENIIRDMSGRAILYDTVDGLDIVNNRLIGIVDDQDRYWATGSSDNIRIVGNSPIRKQTSSASAANVQVFNVSAQQNDAFTATVRAVGRQDDGTDHAYYEITGLFSTEGGTTTQIGSTLADKTIESDATWVGPSLVVASNDIFVKIAGATSQTIDWQIETDLVSVSA